MPVKGGNQQILRITSTSKAHVRAKGKGIHRTTEPVPLKLQVKPTFEYFLEIAQEVKEGNAGKGWDGLSDLRIKERKAEEARDFSGFHDSVVTSTALWPSGFDLKGSKAVLSGQSVKLQQVPCDGKTPAVSWGDPLGSYKGVSHMLRNSYFPLVIVLFDWRAVMVFSCVSSDAQMQ